jgi:type III pantothenate kinase
MKKLPFGRSSVGNMQNKLLSFENRLIVHFVSHEDVFPFNLYETPKTLELIEWFLAAVYFTISYVIGY